jgi:LysM repeat protein
MVNHIGRREGGYLRPHFSHQSGRDVDLGFYYRPHFSARSLKNQTRIAAMEMEANWALVKALAAKADVQVILLDKKVQAALHDYAAQKGEDPALLFALFKAGANAKFRHARKHKDHYHVRFFSPKAQELGRRVQPLLAQRSDENKVIHRVRRGETLGQLARKYGSSVAMIQKASALKGHFLSLGRTLVVPLRGPCTKCPTAPMVVVPPRLLSNQSALLARKSAPQLAPFDEALRSPHVDFVGGETFSSSRSLSGISMRTWVQR